MVAALVLAAGRSTRMAPDNKLLLCGADGQPMVGRVVQACVGSRAACVVVVTGHQSDAVETAVGEVSRSEKIRFVHAARFAEGLSASLRAGLTALPPEVGAALVCLGDMPMVGAAAMNSIIAAHAPSRGHGIVVPVWHGRRGNPVLWDRRFFAEICALSGDAGARGLMQGHADSLCEVMADDESVLTDFDDPADGSAFRLAARHIWPQAAAGPL